MADIVRTSDFYEIAAIKDRLAAKLNSGEWPNIKNTDLGQALLAFGANVVNQEALAFFTAMEQMFLSTCTEQGYMEAIAKNYGIVAETYQSAHINVAMRFSADKTFDPHDLCVSFGDFRFYNIDTLTFTSGVEQTVVLYEGTVVRQSSVIHTPPGKQWTYSQLPAAVTRTLGSQNLQRYLIIPKAAYVPSISVSVAANTTAQTLYWQRVDNWFGYGEYDRIYVIEKDYVGRYWVVFGDGEFGASYPLDQVVNLRYLISNGSNAEISDFSDYVVFEQDYYDITGSVYIPEGGISSLTAGSDAVDIVSLREAIYNKQSSYQRLVRIDDYRSYLNSRTDVLDSVVLSERDINPPNQEMFNVLLYSVKPLTESSSVNIGEIQNYVAKYGLQTVEFRYTPVEFVKFNIWLQLSALSGYNASSLLASASSVLNSTYSWDSIGFNEIINSQKVMSEMLSIEGIDFTRFVSTVEAVYTDAANGQSEFDFGDTSVALLPFYPKRYGLALTSAEFAGVPNNRCFDDGNGVILGDFAGQEAFSAFATGSTGVTAMTGTGVMLICNGTASLRIMDTLRSSGAVSTVTMSHAISVVHYDSGNDIIYGLTFGATPVLRSWHLNRSQVTQENPAYLQKQESPSLTLTDSVNLSTTITTGMSRLVGCKYFNGYVYILVNYTTGVSRLYRYSAAADGTLGDTYDTAYGAVNLLDRDYSDFEIVKSQYGDATNTVWAVHAAGLDIVDDFDTSPETPRLVHADTGGLALTAGRNHEVYYGTSGSEVVRVYGLARGGTPQTTTLTTAANGSVLDLEYFLDPNDPLATGRLHFVNLGNNTISKIASETESQTPTLRAGQAGVTAAADSIYRAATVDYLAPSVTFSTPVSGCTLAYQVDGDLSTFGMQLAVANVINVSEKV